jgi:hypothetical protein
MSVGSFLSFGIENAKRHFLKFLWLSAISFVALCIGIASYAVLPKLLFNAEVLISALLVTILSIIISFNFYKNILNLCRGGNIDIMAFMEAKPETLLNFSVLMLLMSIALSIGYALFIVPGIVLTVMLLPAPFFVFYRNMGPIEAISESIKMTSGHKMDIFAGFFIGMAIAYFLSIFIITIIFTVPMSMFIYVYPYLHLTGQLNEAKKNLEADA